MVFFVILLIVAAFGLGVYVGYKVPHEVKLLAAPKKSPEAPFTAPPATGPVGISETARKLAEEFKK